MVTKILATIFNYEKIFYSDKNSHYFIQIFSRLSRFSALAIYLLKQNEIKNGFLPFKILCLLLQKILDTIPAEGSIQ